MVRRRVLSVLGARKARAVSAVLARLEARSGLAARRSLERPRRLVALNLVRRNLVDEAALVHVRTRVLPGLDIRVLDLLAVAPLVRRNRVLLVRVADSRKKVLAKSGLSSGSVRLRLGMVSRVRARTVPMPVRAPGSGGRGSLSLPGVRFQRRVSLDSSLVENLLSNPGANLAFKSGGKPGFKKAGPGASAKPFAKFMKPSGKGGKPAFGKGKPGGFKAPFRKKKDEGAE